MQPGPQTPPVFISVNEVAQELSIGLSLAWKSVHSGEIRSVRLGRRVLVPRSEIERLTAEALGRQQA